MSSSLATNGASGLDSTNYVTPSLVLSYTMNLYFVGTPERMYYVEISSYEDRTPTNIDNFTFPPPSYHSNNILSLISSH